MKSAFLRWQKYFEVEEQSDSELNESLLEKENGNAHVRAKQGLFLRFALAVSIFLNVCLLTFGITRSFGHPKVYPFQQFYSEYRC